MGGQERLKRLDRPLGLVLLCEGEGGVDEDDDDDRDRDRHYPGRPRQPGRRPQQQRERVRELCGELARPAPPATAPELVGPVDDQPSFRLTVREPARIRAQVAQQQLDALGRLESQPRAGLHQVGHVRRHATIPAMSKVESPPIGLASASVTTRWVTPCTNMNPTAFDRGAVATTLTARLTAIVWLAIVRATMASDAPGGQVTMPTYMASATVARSTRASRSCLERG